MLLNYYRILTVSCLLVLLAGCASQSNIKLADSFWQNKQQKIVVAATKAPTPGLHTEGQQGLLDVAINSAMTSDMDKALQRTNLKWYRHYPKKFVENLKQREVEASYYPEPIIADEKNYPGYMTRTNANRFLLIKLEAIGATRRYYGFIPTGAPEAYCVIKGELINDKNKVLWRHKAIVKQPVQGEWDQAPGYPNLMNAVKATIKICRQEVFNSFFSGH